MSARTLHVLHVEDSPEDARLVRAALEELPNRSLRLTHVPTLAQGFQHLADGGIDVLLLDLSLPDALGLETLELARSRTGTVPIVVMSGFDDEDVALAAVQQGAQDYLIKGRLTPDSLARALRYAIERKALDRLREEFFHNVNHELRTPLSSVYGALSILDEGAFGTLTPEQAPIVEIALRGVEHLLKMTEDLAGVLRTETGKLSMHPERVSLPPVVGEVTDLLARSKSAQHLSLSAQVPGDLPPVHADPARLRQVLINLVGNAIKFTPEGGSIAVRADLWEKRPEFVRLAVADTGCGVDPEAAQRLFDRLYQAPRSAKTYHRGLGIGLYLCRDIVTRHGGEIWLESAVGKGSTFYLTLPVFR